MSGNVYFILGATGSGRRAIVADLIEAGLPAGTPAAVWLAAGERPDPAGDAALAALPSMAAGRWAVAEGGGVTAPEPLSGAVLFFLADGSADPAAQVEMLAAWLLARPGRTLARIIAVVDCGLAGRHPELEPWFDACAHFSDAVLLTHRGGADNRWVSSFLVRQQKKLCHPGIFEVVHDLKVANPALILEPQARRVSLLFDAAEDLAPPLAAGIEIEGDEDAGDAAAGGEDGAVPVADPWLERKPNGRRVREIPDIRPFLVSLH